MRRRFTRRNRDNSSGRRGQSSGPHGDKHHTVSAEDELLMSGTDRDSGDLKCRLLSALNPEVSSINCAMATRWAWFCVGVF